MVTRVQHLSQGSDESMGQNVRAFSNFPSRRSSHGPHTQSLPHTAHTHMHTHSVQSLRDVLEDGAYGLEERVMEEIGCGELFGRGEVFSRGEGFGRGGSVVMARNHGNSVQQRSLSMDF